MASVKSMGFRRPSALDYLVSESILPKNPSPDLYKCTTYGQSDTQGEEELLMTRDCVVWSQGTVIRRIFRFTLEEQEVRQAVLTWFPLDGSKSETSDLRKGLTKPEHRALVVILVHKAHVYFLKGSSHVFNLPFEVQHAFPIPQGVLLQRKRSNVGLAPLTPAQPSVPPNSFRYSQTSIWPSPSGRIDDWGADRSPLRTTASTDEVSLTDLVIPHSAQATEKLPRHFMLSDPLSQIGLVVEGQKSDLDGSPIDLTTIEEDEEIIYASPSNELKHHKVAQTHPLTLILTLNRAKHSYTLWHAFFIDDGPKSFQSSSSQKAFKSSARSKKRNSRATRANTGMTTPAIRQPEGLRSATDAKHGKASFGGSQTAKSRLSESYNFEHDEEADFSSQAENQHATRGVRGGNNRRASSMLARAELSSQEQHTLTDILKNPPIVSGGWGSIGRRGQSFGGVNDRGSLGKSRLSGRASTTGSLSLLSDLDETTQKDFRRPDTVDELVASEFFDDTPERTSYVAARLMNRFMMIKVTSVQCQEAHMAGSPGLLTLTDTMKTFTASADYGLPATNTSTPSISLFLVDSGRASAQELLLETRILPLDTAIETSKDQESARTTHLIVPSRVAGVKTYSTTDLVKVCDDYTSRLLGVDSSKPECTLSLTAPGLQTSAGNGSASALLSQYSGISLDLDNFHMPDAVDCLLDHSTLRNPLLSHVTSQEATRGQVLMESGTGQGKVYTRNVRNHYSTIKVQLSPYAGHAVQILELCNLVLSDDANPRYDSRSIWQSVSKTECTGMANRDWMALIITLLYTVLKMINCTDKVSASRPGLSLSDSDDPAAYSGPWQWLHDQWAKESGRRGMMSREQNPVTARKPLFSFVLKCSKIARKLHANELRSEKTSLSSEGSRLTEAVHDKLKRLVLVLHLFREERKLDILSSDASRSNWGSLGPVIAQIGYWLGWSHWSWLGGQYFNSENGVLDQWAFDEYLPQGSKPPQPCEPPSILKWLAEANHGERISGFPRLDFLLTGVDSESDAGNAPWSRDILTNYTPRTQALRRFFDTTSDPKARSTSPIERMLACGIDLRMLETLPESVTPPFRGYQQQWQAVPPTTWHESLLKLVSRQDLNSLLGNTVNASDAGPLAYPTNARASKSTHAPKSASATHHDESKSSNSLKLKLNGNHSERLDRKIFRQDRRWQEAQKLVNPSRIQVAEIKPGEGQSDAAFLEVQTLLAELVYQRTFALPSGQGALHFGVNMPLLNEKLSMTGFNHTCNMQPGGLHISADRSNYPEEKVGWAFFHAGASVGLRVPRDARGIDNSWLILNKPNDLGTRHAGFLLAIGLNGHLRKMAAWLAFKYLTPKHAMTSVGLLLGLSASHLGTMSSVVTRLLSIHATRLLPEGAAELNVTPLAQTAAIMGVGLLYYNSHHRRMSEVMLSEMEHVNLAGPPSDRELAKDEAYRLAAGFSLGLINLGQGNDLSALHGLRVVERLLLVATGSRDVKFVHVLDQATSGAVMAVALIFMKTHDTAVAAKIDVPTTARRHDSIRPDILLLRTVAKWLIMWDSIEPSMAWVNRHCPREWRSTGPEETWDDFMNIVSDVAFSTDSIPSYNILAGLCWSIALKYAGTNSQAAMDVLRYYSGQVQAIISDSEATSFETELTKEILLRFLHLLGLAMATVYAGTGNLEVFRVLRSMHADVHKSFGFHQATHIAIGILFMGHGRYSLCTSNLAIAAMLCAFYPVFPKDVIDNSAHLQAMRHFWVFASEARCLITRDIETHQPIVTPIRVTLRSGDKSQTPLLREAPCLLPEVDTVAQVHAEHPDYWPVVLDFANNPAHLATFRKHQTIFLRRKPLLAQYGSVFGSTLGFLERQRHGRELDPFERVLSLPFLKRLGVDGTVVFDILATSRVGPDEMGRWQPPGESEAQVHTLLDMRTTALDDFLALKAGVEQASGDRLIALWKLLNWSTGRRRGERAKRRGSEWLRTEWMSVLRAVLVRRRVRAMTEVKARGGRGGDAPAGGDDAMAVD